MSDLSVPFASESTKLCRVCGTSKPLDKFHRRKESPDGFRNECSECRIARQKEYSRSPRGKEVQTRADKLRHAKFRNRRFARSRLFYALREGFVSRLPCWCCGNEESEAHHPDYSMPLDVVWLCKIHHKQLHLEAAENEPV